MELFEMFETKNLDICKQSRVSATWMNIREHRNKRKVCCNELLHDRSGALGEKEKEVALNYGE